MLALECVIHNCHVHCRCFAPGPTDSPQELDSHQAVDLGAGLQGVVQQAAQLTLREGGEQPQQEPSTLNPGGAQASTAEAGGREHGHSLENSTDAEAEQRAKEGAPPR
jgi:hypothetical protein